MSCGPGKVGDWLVPDSVFGNACREHDEYYAAPGPLSRSEVDRRFYVAMLKAAKDYKGPKRRALRFRAWLYWSQVRLWGWAAWKG